MTKQLTAAEARAHMAQGPHYRVRDCDGDKWQLVEGGFLCKCQFTGKWRITTCNPEDYAPFSPYVDVSKRELRERAERAEAQIAVLTDERDALIERIKHLSSAHTTLLVANLPPAPDTKKFIERLQAAQKATREHNIHFGSIPDQPKDPIDAVPSGTYTAPKSAPPVVGLLYCDCGWSGTHDALWTGEVYLCPLCAEVALSEEEA